MLGIWEQRLAIATGLIAAAMGTSAAYTGDINQQPSTSPGKALTIKP